MRILSLSLSLQVYNDSLKAHPSLHSSILKYKDRDVLSSGYVRLWKTDGPVLGLRCSTTSGLSNVKANRGHTYYCKCSLSTITLWDGDMWVICFFILVLFYHIGGSENPLPNLTPKKCSYCTSYKSLPYQCFTYWSPNVGGAPIRPAAFPNSGNGAAGVWKKQHDRLRQDQERRGSMEDEGTMSWITKLSLKELMTSLTCIFRFW